MIILPSYMGIIINQYKDPHFNCNFCISLSVFFFFTYFLGRLFTCVLGVDSALQCLGHPWSAECGWELVSGSIEAVWPDLTEEIGREGCRNGFCQLGRWHQTCPDDKYLTIFFLGQGFIYKLHYIIPFGGGGNQIMQMYGDVVGGPWISPTIVHCLGW